MPHKVNKKSNKRELIESESYYRHGRARPYDRAKTQPFVIEEELTEQDKIEILGNVLGDWDSNGV